MVISPCCRKEGNFIHSKPLFHRSLKQFSHSIDKTKAEFSFSEKGGYGMSSKIKILDATLREGEQQQGVRFTAREKITILKQLEEFGVDYIEAGHPGISAED